MPNEPDLMSRWGTQGVIRAGEADRIRARQEGMGYEPGTFAHDPRAAIHAFPKRKESSLGI